MIKLDNQTTTTVELLEILKYLYSLEENKLKKFTELLPQLQNTVIRELIDDVLCSEENLKHKYSENIISNWELIEFFVKRGISLSNTSNMDLRQSLYTILSKMLDEGYFAKEILLLKNLRRIGVERVFHYSSRALQYVEDKICVSDRYSKRIYTDGSFLSSSTSWSNRLEMTTQEVQIIGANWIIEVKNTRGNSTENNSSIIISDVSEINFRKLPSEDELNRMYYSKEWKPRKNNSK